MKLAADVVGWKGSSNGRGTREKRRGVRYFCVASKNPKTSIRRTVLRRKIPKRNHDAPYSAKKSRNGGKNLCVASKNPKKSIRRTVLRRKIPKRKRDAPYSAKKSRNAPKNSVQHQKTLNRALASRMSCGRAGGVSGSSVCGGRLTTGRAHRRMSGSAALQGWPAALAGLKACATAPTRSVHAHRSEI